MIALVVIAAVATTLSIAGLSHMIGGAASLRHSIVNHGVIDRRYATLVSWGVMVLELALGTATIVALATGWTAAGSLALACAGVAATYAGYVRLARQRHPDASCGCGAFQTTVSDRTLALRNWVLAALSISGGLWLQLAGEEPPRLGAYSGLMGGVLGLLLVILPASVEERNGVVAR